MKKFTRILAIILALALIATVIATVPLIASAEHPTNLSGFTLVDGAPIGYDVANMQIPLYVDMVTECKDTGGTDIALGQHASGTQKGKYTLFDGQDIPFLDMNYNMGNIYYKDGKKTATSGAHLNNAIPVHTITLDLGAVYNITAMGFPVGYGSDRYVFVKSAKTAEELVTAENTLVNPSQKLKNNPNNADMALNKLTMDKTGRFITVSFYSDTMAKTKQPINLKELYFFGEKPIEGVCNLEFDTMGGSALEKQNAAQGVLYSTLTIPTPVKVGYNFGGWSDTAGGAALDFATAVVPAELKHTLYAVWNLIESSETVQLDLQGGDHADAVGGIVSIPSVATGTLWSTVLSGKAPTKTIDGNTFNLRGWYYDAALTLPVGATDVVLQGKTVLYAKYIIPVKLNVNTNTGVYEDGTTIEKTIEVIPDTPIGKTVYDTLMSYRVKKESADTIYEFRGFSKRNNNDLSTLINEKTVFAETDTVIYAVFMQYKIITFVDPSDDRVLLTEKCAPYDGFKWYTVNAPEKAGFVFSGWYKDKECTQAHITDNINNQGLTAYAKYVPGYEMQPSKARIYERSSDAQNFTNNANSRFMDGDLTQYFSPQNFVDLGRDIPISEFAVSIGASRGADMVIYYSDSSKQSPVDITAKNDGVPVKTELMTKRVIPYSEFKTQLNYRNQAIGSSAVYNNQLTFKLSADGSEQMVRYIYFARENTDVNEFKLITKTQQPKLYSINYNRGSDVTRPGHPSYGTDAIIPPYVSTSYSLAEGTIKLPYWEGNVVPDDRFLGWAKTTGANIHSPDFVGMNYTPTKEEDVTLYAVWGKAYDLKILGTQLRVSGKTGIRFTLLDNKFTEANGYTNVEHGMLIVPVDLLQGSLDLNNGSVGTKIMKIAALNYIVTSEVRGIQVAVGINTSDITDSAALAYYASGTLYAGVITGAFETTARKDRTLSVRAYVTATDKNGNPVTEYSEVYNDSVYAASMRICNARGITYQDTVVEGTVTYSAKDKYFDTIIGKYAG